MQLTDLEKQMEDLPKKSKKSIVALIDTKTEHEMEKVLSKLNTMEQKFDAKFEGMDAKFEGMDAKFDSFQFKLNIILWAFGVLLAVMTIFRFTS